MYSDIKYIVGEAIIILVGSITAAAMTIRDGLWGKPNRISAIKNDIITSGAMAALFSIVAAFLIYKFTNNIQRSVICAIYFLVFATKNLLCRKSNRKIGVTGQTIRTPQLPHFQSLIYQRFQNVLFLLFSNK